MDEALRMSIEEGIGGRAGWLIRFRWFVISGKLLLILIISYFLPGVLPVPYLLATVAGLVICNVIFLIYSQRLSFLRQANLVYTQLILDILFLTIYLHFLGGLETPLFFFYLIYVVIASILFSRRFSFAYAGLASFLYLALLVLEGTGLIPHYNLSGFRIPSRFREPVHIFTTSLTLTTTSLLAAYFASTVVAKLRDANLVCKETVQELGELNTQLRELDKARAQFLRLVTHELRAPVAAMQSYLKLIIEGYVAPEKEREIIQKVERQAMEQLDLINDLLQLARIHEAKAVGKIEFTPVNIAEVLNEVSDLMRARAVEKNISFDVQIEPNLPPVKAGAEHMRQLWTDLISNAIKYTPPGGTVTVSLSQNSDRIVGIVQDTGIGIPAEDIPHIFNEFYRAKNAKAMERDGTGLGLSIVRRILETYGGEISVESELGKGSKFTFSLPKGEQSPS